MLENSSTHKNAPTIREANLLIPGRRLEGIIQAKDFLLESKSMHLDGKHVAVLGGGEKALPSARLAIQKGAASVKVFEMRSRPALLVEEVFEREWSRAINGFIGEDGKVTHLLADRVVKARQGGYEIVPDEERRYKADLVLIALD